MILITYRDFSITPSPVCKRKCRLKRFFDYFLLNVAVKHVLCVFWWRWRYPKVSPDSGLSFEHNYIASGCIGNFKTITILSCWLKKSTKNQRQNLLILKSTRVDFARLKTTNASRRNIIMFERKPRVWRYFRIPSTSPENT